jgi:predicted transposase YbfD/YdcC
MTRRWQVDTYEQRSFQDFFDDLEDPRIDRTKLYPLIEILFIIICGMICGSDSWRDFVDFGESKLSYLRRFFPFKNGIPSKNTFARVMSAINVEQFKKCFLNWMKCTQVGLKEVIAIDGKTLRRSFDNAKGQAALHLISAYATSLKLVLAQEKVADKSNEITAIPELLNVLAIKGAIISIDAMGCQKEIAKQIREKEADYVLSLKGNQGTLHQDVKLFLESEIIKPNAKQIAFHEEMDGEHSRIETRRYYVSEQTQWLTQKNEWKDLKSIAMVESIREMGDKVSIERRFYITSLAADAKLTAHAIRSHWAIENSLHWILDVTFREDDSRIREKSAVENIGLVRKIALNLLQSAKKKFKEMSIRRLRKKAGWDDATLDLILQADF